MVVGRSRWLTQIQIPVSDIGAKEVDGEDGVVRCVSRRSEEVSAERNGVEVALPEQIATERADVPNIEDGGITNVALNGEREVHHAWNLGIGIEAKHVGREERASGALQCGHGAVEERGEIDDG